MSDTDYRPFHRDPVAVYDSLGRKVPGKVGIYQVLRFMPSLLKHFTRDVPADRMVVSDSDTDRVAKVTCVCGQTPEVAFNRVVRCEGEGCRRWFLFDGKRVRVAREPEETEPRTTVVD